ncbi:MAG: polyprenyl synthetase family protein [Candidatus Sericytochromatia bacterium]
MSLEAVFERADASLQAASDGPESLALMRAAFRPQVDLAERLGAWPVAELPLSIASAIAGDAEAAVRLAAACTLFFAGADVIDDAEDGDLDAEGFGSWQQAVSVGQALSFLAPRVAASAALPRRRAAVAEAFLAAGLAMSLGQRRDLARHGAAIGQVKEADYLETVAGKSGAAFKLYAGLPAIALGGSAALVSALSAFGQRWGAAIQLASDLADMQAPQSRDHRQQLPTLPLIACWQLLAPADRPLLLAAWAGEPGAPPLPFLLDRSGAMAYSRARLAAMRLEAEQALSSRAVPEGLRQALAPFGALLVATPGLAFA